MSTCNISQSYYLQNQRIKKIKDYPLYIFITVKTLSTVKRTSASIAIFKVFIKISEIFEERIFYKNSKFEASQHLINAIQQIKYQFLTDIWIIRKNENNNW